jgi:hypothetical protein
MKKNSKSTPKKSRIENKMSNTGSETLQTSAITSFREASTTPAWLGACGVAAGVETDGLAVLSLCLPFPTYITQIG